MSAYYVPALEIQATSVMTAMPAGGFVLPHLTWEKTVRASRSSHLRRGTEGTQPGGLCDSRDHILSTHREVTRRSFHSAQSMTRWQLTGLCECRGGRAPSCKSCHVITRARITSSYVWSAYSSCLSSTGSIDDLLIQPIAEVGQLTHTCPPKVTGSLSRALALASVVHR